MKKRILSCLLSIAMCLTLLPLGIQAQAAYFGDVTSHWARSYIEDAVDMGLFNGTAPNRFEPESAMTRAMFVTVLYRMDGGEAERSANFIDVPRGSWYSDAVAWASENSIVTGTSAIRFSPNDSVTREQMVTILNRYLTASGAALGSDGEAPAISFRDSSSIAPYAREAVEKMQRASIVSGKPSGFGYRFDPQGCATRAEVACIMCKFLDQLSYDDIDNEEPDPEAAYEQMDKITQSSTLKSLSSQYENASDSQKKNLAEQAISYFEQQEENGAIDYCDVDRDSGVIQYWVDGLEAYYLLYDLDKVANGDASSVSSALTASASTYATDVVGAVSRTTTVTSGKALVLESYASSASSDIAKDFHYRSSYFKQCAENSGLTTTIQTGITVANLQRGLASYDVLYFNMHGALYNDEPFICLEEKATLEKYVKTYSTDVKDGNVCLYGTFNSSGTQFMIRSSFFPAHYSRDTGNKLSAKWVHLGTCYGMSGSKSLSYDLSEAGAGCITGYSGETWLLYDEWVLNGIFNYMCDENKTIGANYTLAVSRARQKTENEPSGTPRLRNDCRPNMVVYGNADIIFLKPESIIDTSAYIQIQLEPNLGTVRGGSYSLYRVNSDGSETQVITNKSFTNDYFLISGLEDAQNYRVKISPTGYGQASVTVMAVQHSKPTSVYVKQREITVIPTDPSKPTTP
ncbi:MAG: S-layer homology domain-containing protein, partial [Butyricicoccus sp.]|nr:S-layer homology domain-containing protein [Butyricicoccus sp.]